ncbi:MAG: FAD-dependent oxidoreductase, partial [Armatimonadota bacterium]|nr:FAD-dependent oxidoreductase [Armatimonadota bacterium]
MATHDYPVIAEADVAVMGGGLAGVAAALAAAAAGRHTLLVESRPLLGWEVTSAFVQRWPGAQADDAPVVAAVRAAGGLQGERLDPPICEMVLERLAAQ